MPRFPASPTPIAPTGVSPVPDWSPLLQSLSAVLGRAGVAALLLRSLHLFLEAQRGAQARSWRAQVTALGPQPELSALQALLRESPGGSAPLGAQPGVLWALRGLLQQLLGPDLSQTLEQEAASHALQQPEAWPSVVLQEPLSQWVAAAGLTH
jgi:hypothetical protein